MIADFKKKQNKNISARAFLAIGGILILVFSISLIIADIKIYKKRKTLIYQIEKLENKVQDIKNQNDSLNQKISEAKDNEYVEKVAREELDLQKSGEKVFSFVAPDGSQQKEEQKKEDLLQSWFGWLGKIFSPGD